MDAHNDPAFHRQLGKDPDQLFTRALQLLVQKFNLDTRK
jgi:hypothetical protein